jgi:transposase InsO family protein
MTVVRFCDRYGIPRATWYYWRRLHLAGREVHRWPAPVVDAIEEPTAATAHKWSQWGHRKIWKLLRRDGYLVSESSVKRAMARRGLLMPARYQGELRALARARRAVFTKPPKRRNRVWQTDFSEFETAHGGIWQLSGYVDYATKFMLALDAFGSKTAPDALANLKAALAEAERLLGKPIAEDCVDPETGEVFPLVIVTDNGPCYRSADFAAFIAARRPWLYHVRTRYRSPWTNGVIERTFGTIKYEGLYREEITDGYELGEELKRQRHIYNEIRPHEGIDFDTPAERYLAAPPRDDPSEIELPNTTPPLSYNPNPPRPRTRRPPGPPRHGRAPADPDTQTSATTAAGVKAPFP